MTAHNSQDSLKFALPNMLSYHTTWDDADYEPQFPRRRSHPFARLVATLGVRLRAARARRAAASELIGMSDGELADIGISRCDVNRVLGPEFVPDYQRADI